MSLTVLLPLAWLSLALPSLWDWLFGTADFDSPVQPTGIRDQVEQGRDCGQGLWSQQVLGLRRLGQALRGRTPSE